MKKIQFYNLQEQQFYNKQITCFIKKGKKTLLLKIFLRLSFLFRKKCGIHFSSILYTIIQKYAPSVQLRSIRVAGSNYIIPFELDDMKRKVKMFHFFKEVISLNEKNKFLYKLVYEVLKMLDGISFILKKKEEIHKKAEQGSPFLHYRW